MQQVEGDIRMVLRNHAVVKEWLVIKKIEMTSNRDLLVMFKQKAMSQQDIDRQVTQLNEILFTTERLDNFVRAHEIIDLNKYKLIKNPIDIKKILRQKKLSKPFIFLNNKN